MEVSMKYVTFAIKILLAIVSAIAIELAMIPYQVAIIDFLGKYGLWFWFIPGYFCLILLVLIVLFASPGRSKDTTLMVLTTNSMMYFTFGLVWVFILVVLTLLVGIRQLRYPQPQYVIRMADS